MNYTYWLEPGAIDHLGQVLDELKAESVLLVADADAYRLSGAQETLRGTFAPRRIVSFTGFEPNPDFHDLQRGLDTLRGSPCDVALAIGGGTAIDLAKLISTLAVQRGSALQIIQGQSTIQRDGVPLIAVPTTAGTGSEATRNAVVYLDGQKYSPEHEFLLPQYAIVDPQLTYSLPPHITASSGLDALAQAVESMWSVGSTKDSRSWAAKALGLAMTHLEDAVKHPGPESRRAMCEAAHLAGKAINVSRTTAPHAISYTLTSRFNVPHGCAVALTLGSILVYNSKVMDSDCTDPRGPGHVRRTVREIVGLLGCSTPEQANERITALVSTIRCPIRLRDVGVGGQREITFLVDQVNTQRLANNPRQITPATLRNLLERLS